MVSAVEVVAAAVTVKVDSDPAVVTVKVASAVEIAAIVRADTVVVKIVVRARRVVLRVNSRLLSVVDSVVVAVRLPRSRNLQEQLKPLQLQAGIDLKDTCFTAMAISFERFR